MPDAHTISTFWQQPEQNSRGNRQKKTDALLSVLAQQGPPKFGPSLQLNVIHSPVQAPIQHKSSSLIVIT
jgi:hypothetical protein